jgi:hypothetical protein
MERAGGFRDYLALRQDAAAYEDLLLAMAGDAEAETIRQIERRARGH